LCRLGWQRVSLDYLTTLPLQPPKSLFTAASRIRSFFRFRIASPGHRSQFALVASSRLSEEPPPYLRLRSIVSFGLFAYLVLDWRGMNSCTFLGELSPSNQRTSSFASFRCYPLLDRRRDLRDLASPLTPPFLMPPKLRKSDTNYSPFCLRVAFFKPPLFMFNVPIVASAPVCFPTLPPRPCPPIMEN